MTINEIAQLAGVSISTVSKIMNHKDHNISPQTREKVLNIAKEYNYSPYSFAKDASTSKSFLLGVLVNHDSCRGGLADGVISQAREQGYHVILCDSGNSPELELKHITALCRAKIDGVIWEPVSAESIARRKYFDEIGACITWLNCDRPDSHSIDYQKLIYCAAEYFIQHNHKYFSLLTDSSSADYEGILAGYRLALFEHQLPFDEDSLLSFDASDWIPRIKTSQLTGIISTDYDQAVRLYRLLKEYLYEIPYDFSIITLINDKDVRTASLDISAISIPFHSFGQYLCRQLLAQCEQHAEDTLPFVPDCRLISHDTLDTPSSGKLPHIIVVGSINIDTTLNVKHLPSLGGIVTTPRHTISPGGKGINQAVGVAKLNHKVTLLGNVGNDLDTGLVYSCLKDYGIDNSGIQKDKAADTGRAYIHVQDNGESFITIMTGANTTLKAQTLRNNSHLFHNCAYCLMQTEIAMEAVEEAAAIAKEQGAKTILKPSAVSSLSDTLLKNIDILVPNQAEMALLCGCEPASSGEDLGRQAKQMLDKGIDTVIITLGSRGCFFKDASGEQFFPAADFIPMDSTGGSDAFISALASYLLYGYDMRSAIQIASYAAGFCISRQGVVPALIDQTSLEKYIMNICPELLK